MIERVSLRPGYWISRVIRGGWQLAGGHGPVDRERALDDLSRAFESGIVTFDCADIYTGVEDLIGEFCRRYAARYGAGALAALRVHTKFVPDLEILPRIQRDYVRLIIERSLKRLGRERLDLVQFHWWEYGIDGMIETAAWLTDLRSEGLIEEIGGTNFDASHTRALLEAGIPLLTMQVQYSLLDDRPAHSLASVCAGGGTSLLAYGTVAGGFLSDRWLGAPEPQPPFAHRSLTKYKLIVDEFGGWQLFAELLRALRRIADRHATDIATIASAWVLAQPAVAAVIVGARNAEHLDANAAISAVRLEDDDLRAISGVLARRRGPAGDCFELERDRAGRHGSIMNYNLNTGER